MKDLPKLLDKIADPTTVSDADLEATAARLRELAESTGDDPDDSTLEQLEQIADAIDKIRAEQDTRSTAASERAERAKAVKDRIRGPEAEAGPEDEDPDDDGDEGDEPEVPEAEKVLEPVAAAAKPAIVKVRSVTRPKAMTVKPTDIAPPERWGLVASANVPGFAAGEPLDDMDKIARAWWEAVQATRNYRVGPRVKMPLGRMGSENLTDIGYTEDRILGRDSRANARKLANTVGSRHVAANAQAIVAAGGIGVPQQVRYDLPILPSTDARPVRDTMLTRFGADRGGVTLLPPPILTDLDDAVDVWTEANDTTPSSPTEKPCLTVTAPGDDVTTLVEAITRCLQFGNFRQRFFPEQIEAWMTLLGANWARFAESRLLTKIGDGSTQVNTDEVLGTTRDVLATLDRATSQIRNRWRLSPTYPLRFGAPEWLKSNIRADLVRELPGSAQERFATADNEIDGWLRARNVNVTWFLDGETGQIYGGQGDAPLNPWITSVVTYLYPEGTWLFLDGGTLDLGIVRDSTLNATNDVQMFAESFENVAFHGVESYRLLMDICPNGATAATVEIDPCTVGS